MNITILFLIICLLFQWICIIYNAHKIACLEEIIERIEKEKVKE